MEREDNFYRMLTAVYEWWVKKAEGGYFLTLYSTVGISFDQLGLFSMLTYMQVSAMLFPNLQSVSFLQPGECWDV